MITQLNLQNIPSAPEYRKAFNAPEGYKIVNADYSGQESIVLVNISKDKDMIEFYQSGGADLHAFVASKIWPELRSLSHDEIKKDHKQKRNIAKAANFALAYGGTGHTISKNLGIPEAQGEFVYNAFFEAFPGLKDFFQKCRAEAVANGFITIDTVTGRRYIFSEYTTMLAHKKKGNYKEANKLKGKLERASVNYKIQGTSGSMTKLAIVLFREEQLKRNSFDYYQITNVIHDEINCEAREDYAQECATLLEECMVKAADIWCKTVRMKAEAVIGDYWAH